jgi:hypothetical protein
MELTAEQRAVLAHVVTDPDAWAEHALATIGAGAIEAKVARHTAAYEAAKAAQGNAYRTRAERDATAP